MEQGAGEDDPTVTERVFCTKNISLLDATRLTENLAQKQYEEALRQSRNGEPTFIVTAEMIPSSSAQNQAIHDQSPSTPPATSAISASMQPQLSQASNATSTSEESIVIIDYEQALPIIISSGQQVHLYDSTPDLSDADSNSPIVRRRNQSNLESDTSTEEDILQEYQSSNGSMRER